MSNIPLRFGNWWDFEDFDDFGSRCPRRTTRLLDQHFGNSLRRNDLLSSLANTHISNLSRQSPYYRPWNHANPIARQDSGSTVNVEQDKFEIILDVQQFTPEEISVKSNEKFIIVEGKHEEKQDEHGFVSRHFVRKYQLPPTFKQELVESTLSSDGILTISAVKPAIQASNQDQLRSVPITPVGPKKDSTEAVKSDDHSQPKIEQMN